MKKKWISGILSALILITPIPAFADASFKIGNGQYNINGKIKEDAAPYIKNGHTYLPLRYVAYAVGIGDNSLYWDDEHKVAILAKDEQLVIVKIGEPSIFVSGKVIPTETAAEISKERVMLPLRAISEALGCQVEWDVKTKTVVVKEQ